MLVREVIKLLNLLDRREKCITNYQCLAYLIVCDHRQFYLPYVAILTDYDAKLSSLGINTSLGKNLYYVLIYLAFSIQIWVETLGFLLVIHCHTAIFV